MATLSERSRQLYQDTFEKGYHWYLSQQEADGDGVIVVPRAHGETVAQTAREVANGDKQSRRARYKEAGLDVDGTVEPLE